MCGIFGIISPNPRKFDLRTFCVLGVNNDSRGGDSCGIFIDKKYEYGVNDLKLFYSFFPKSKLLNSVTTSQIALGHCRKASVGAINAANAQPVVITDDNGDVKYVLMHNGTILNYKDLAKKYIPDIDITGMTDSQVMARIFYHTGYKVLGEYIGAGAFVMVDYRKEEPEVLFFKGESKSTEYSLTTTVERPLFCTYSSTEFIFSSIMEYLKAVRPNREVMTFSTNALITLKDGKLAILKEYDRTKMWQTQYYTYCNNSVSNISVQKKEKDYYGNKFFSNYYWDDVVDMDKYGIYRIGTDKAHGIYWVDALGNTGKEKRIGTIQAAFWKGVLLKNVGCYNFLIKFAKDMDCTHEELLMTLPDLVHYLSPCACWRMYNNIWVTSDTPNSHSKYTGTAIFPFTTEEIYFTNGKLSSYTEGIPYKDALIDLQSSMDYKVDSDTVTKLF